ncbi:VOC family protein [Gordonia sp. HY285]|uniref:VOC family protein n=1 Tax=Gordonia liuliyuniae TaxID=2911517 RepID=A0ABS9IPS2_9ACTN|nr:VOC family protein [Gordonia liuliyuniae]MCF8587552.1 VOC family protein [Gordonia liuliyuniae]MCF8608618.1 VOC family protein [Gordonia liuliyuniae]
MAVDVQITFDAHDPRALSRFWCEVLGYVIPGPPGTEPDPDDPFAAWDEFLARIDVPAEHWNSRSAAEDPTGAGPRLFFQQVPDEKVTKNRVHLDVRAAPGLVGDERMAALATRADHLVALGASRLQLVEPAPPLGQGHIIMADPEGNEFCLD